MRMVNEERRIASSDRLDFSMVIECRLAKVWLVFAWSRWEEKEYARREWQGRAKEISLERWKITKSILSSGKTG